MRQQECPDSETMADYLEGRLNGQPRDRIEAHFSKCSQCLEAMLTIHRTSRMDSDDSMVAVPSVVTQGAITRIDGIQTGGFLDSLMGCIKAWALECSRFLNRLNFPLTGGLVPVRGNKVRLADDIIVFSRSFTGLDTEIEIEKLDSMQANVKVSISGAVLENSQVRISLVRNEREVASYLTGQKNVYFEFIPFGRYTLAFTQHGANIGQFNFNILASDDGGPDA